jgi:hypothetical protein
MNCSSRSRRTPVAHRNQGLEWLERRCLPSGLPPSIASVAPYNGEHFYQSPQEIDIPFNGINVNPLLSGFDVQIYGLNSDGTKSPLWTVNDAPPENTDWTGTELMIPIQSFDTASFSYVNDTLSPGTYEIDLLGGTPLNAVASGAPGPELWDPSQDYAISTFTVLGTGATFASAETITPNAPPVLGSLDPENYASALDLYKFTLPQGHFWQVGISVSAESIGSALLPALALFDQYGNVLATRDTGTGLSNDPNDPYVFEGLAPGTYYIGVSGAGNLPYGSTGYNPISGVPGQSGIVQSGGPFQLALIAAPHDQQTQLVSVTVNRADPTSSSPTSLTLTFSAPVDLSNLFIPDTPETALKVVDSSGRVWPTTSLDYRVQNARLTLVFDEPLPAGHYSLIIPSPGGLTDLSELPVTAPGEPAGVLASWNVAPPIGPSNPNNLGVLWPGISQAASPTEDAADGVTTGAFTETTNLAPAQTQTYRWVVIVPGLYMLQTQTASGQLAIVNFGGGETIVLDSGSNAGTANYVMNLSAGVYGLRLINVGSGPFQVDWLLKIASLDWDKIIDNGVGQVSALSLGFLSPTPSDTGANSSASFPGAALATVTSNFAGSSGPVPTNLLVTSNTSLFGTPTSQNQYVAPVGPAVEIGSSSIAGNSTGLLPGIRYGLVLSPDVGPGEQEQPGPAALADVGSVPSGEEVPKRLAGARPGADPEAGSSRADAFALAQAEWLVRLGIKLQAWLAPSPGLDEIKPPLGPPIERQTIVRHDSLSGRSGPAGVDRNRRSASKAQADFGAAATLVLAGAAVYRLRHPIQKWWRRRHHAVVTPPAPAKPFARGPHPALGRARATTRLRKPRCMS